MRLYMQWREAHHAISSGERIQPKSPPVEVSISRCSLHAVKRAIAAADWPTRAAGRRIHGLAMKVIKNIMVKPRAFRLSTGSLRYMKPQI